MAIHLIVLGKLKESYWQEAAHEYEKRLSGFGTFVTHELREVSFSAKDRSEDIKHREAEKIQAELAKFSAPHIVLLDEHGKNYSSLEFSELVTSWRTTYREIVFVLGGPLGLDETFASSIRTKLSLSSFTFTHQMARVILLEQLYRAFMIAAHRPYHY